MAIDYQALKDEITNNTAALPYPAFTPENDAAIADVGNNAGNVAPRTVTNDTVPTSAIRGKTTYDAFNGFSAGEEAWFKWLTAAEGDIAITTEILENLAGVGGTSLWAAVDRPVMEPRMVALMQRIGSRAEELKDTIGVSSWTPSHVATARQLP